MPQKKWKHIYNLADIIRFHHKKALNFDKETIAYQYISQINKSDLFGEDDIKSKNFRCPDINFNLLCEIVKSKNTRKLKKEEFVMHVRAGDCIGLHKSKNRSFRDFPEPKRFIEIIKKHNLDKEYDKCILVTGNHNNQSILDSNIYIKNLKSTIEDLNLNCEIESNTADEDFALLATAKCFLVGFRGFSWLAASINPNRTIWDVQDPPHFPWLANPRFRNQLINGYHFYKK